MSVKLLVACAILPFCVQVAAEENASEAHCITETDLDTGATCDWHALGCPVSPNINCVNHGWLNSKCLCKPGYHANSTFIKENRAHDDEGWKDYACVPNGDDACYGETDTDTHSWCNYGIYGCPINFSRCVHVSFFHNKCLCEPGYHVPVKGQVANEGNIVNGQKGIACVPDKHKKKADHQWGNAKKISAACNTNSGGSCNVFGCKAYRGKTECTDVGADPFAHGVEFHSKHAMNCTCGEGYCSINANSENDVGECVPEADAQPGMECPKYAWNQSSVAAAGCTVGFDSCEWGDCVDSYCRCPKDFCADNTNAICVPRASSDMQTTMIEVKKVDAAAEYKTRSGKSGLAIGGAFALALALFNVVALIARRAKGASGDHHTPQPQYVPCP